MHRRTFLTLPASALAAATGPLERDDGYRGIWYFNQPSGDQYVYKYSGGFATYPQQHAPIAIYSREANKTFFVYGGTTKRKYTELVHAISYFDHSTGMVPRPRILLNKLTGDAHDNPTLSIDGDGFLWIFSSAHGTSRPAYLHRSRRPLSIDEFEPVLDTNFSYPQPWHIPGKGFLFLHTRYQRLPASNTNGRALYWMTSPDGRRWSDPQRLAFALMGHYQISWPHRDKVGTALNVHPPPLGLNQRTNLYYLETADLGLTWRTVRGEAITPPITTEKHPALVRDYRAEGLLVYLKDLQYDSQGRPVIVYLTSKGYQAGPSSGPRQLWTARWSGKQWLFHTLATTDHNYDFGSLYLDSDSKWRFLAPTAPGPQPHGAGGDIELWSTTDAGQSWRRVRQLTRGGKFNHTYIRRPLHAHPDFYALWADGNPLEASESHLYFTNKSCDRVLRLPSEMHKEMEKPALV
jgi:hypothetical protein